MDPRFLIDQLTSARDRGGWHIQARRLASRRIGALLIDIARTIDEYCVGGYHKAVCPIAGLVDVSTHRDIRIRQVDSAGNVPGWIVALVGNIDAVVDIRILVDRDPRKQSLRGTRRLNVENTTLASRIVGWCVNVVGAAARP